MQIGNENGYYLAAHGEADPADVLQLLNSIWTFAVEHALHENIDAADINTSTSTSDSSTQNSEIVCCALFMQGVHKFDYDEFLPERNLDIHSFVVLSSLRFAFIGAHARAHWSNSDSNYRTVIFVHTCKFSSNLSYLLTEVKSWLAAYQCVIDPGGIKFPGGLGLNLEDHFFGSAPQTTNGEGLTAPISDPISRILEHIESRIPSERIARDGLPYSFCEFVTWYGSHAVQRWCEAAATKSDIGLSMMLRVLERGHSSAERMSPAVSLEGHTLLKKYHWQPQAECYQSNRRQPQVFR